MATTLSQEQPDLSVIENRARSVAHLFIDRVAASPQARAFGHVSDTEVVWLTWAQVDQRVRGIAAGLVARGVQPQDRIAIESSTRVEWALVDLGIMLAGAATTTIYPSTTSEDVLHILRDSGCVLVVAETAAHLKELQELAADAPDVRTLVTLDADAEDEHVFTLAGLEDLGAQALAENPDLLTERIEAIQPEDLATLIYTSGTTGRPKGVRLPHSAWTYEAAAVDSVKLLNSEDLQFLWLPLAHVFGKVLLTLPLQIGFPTAIDGRVEKIVENLPIVQPTWMGAAPRIFEKVYGRITTTVADEGAVKARLFTWASGVASAVSKAREDGQKISPALSAQHAVADALVLKKVRGRFGGRVRFFISGSAALNPDIGRWFDAMGLPILEGYGLTETSAATIVNRPYPGANRIGTVGWPLPGTEVKVSDEGEILVKGPGVMQGYRNLEAATAQALQDGWFHTGDIGEILPTGHVRITDRKKDLFKTSGGKYVAPSSIESSFKAVCPFASQLVVEGDGRKFVSALITLDEEAITGWAAQNGMGEYSYADIVTSAACREMVQGYVDELNSRLNRWEQIKRFLILPRDLTVEEGEITPSLKLKRKAVITRYKNELDDLYQD